MTLSLNEVAVLSRKAARGAGMPWGLAEEAGGAVRWLEARGFLGARALAALLSETDGADRRALTPVPGKVWQADRPLCPIAAGAALSDHADLLAAGPITLGRTRHPLLLLPFLAPTGAGAAGATEIAWDGARLRVGADVAVQGTPGAAKAARVTCARIETAPPPAPRHSRCSLSAPVLARLDAFAARTYAPATEASRLAGAGAGLTDND